MMKIHPASAAGGFGLFNSTLHDPLTVASMAVSAVGTIMQSSAQKAAGKAAQQSADFQAAQYKQNAGQEVAKSQRVAEAERRRTNIAMSNAQAQAASSGGGALDPTVLNITGGLAQQGEYNALSALFEGTDNARSMQLQGDALRIEGSNARKAGNYAAKSTMISGGGGTLFDKYAPASSKAPLPWQRPGNVNPAGGYY